MPLEQFIVPLSPADISAVLIFLRGKLDPREACAAAHWEYARRHNDLLRVAKVARSARNRVDLHQRLYDAMLPNWLMDWQWRAIWESRSFPEKRWVALTAAQKKEVREQHQNFSPTTPITESVYSLLGLRVFERFQQMGQTHTAQPGRIEASVSDGSLERLVVTIDYRNTAESHVRKFAERLQKKAHVFRAHHKETRGSATGAAPFMTALQQLAAWEIFASTPRTRTESMRFEKAGNWTDGKGPFFKSRRKAEPLWSGNETKWRAGIRAAKRFLRDRFPPETDGSSETFFETAEVTPPRTR